jgi:threonine/homoserine/homoserine lactone efflux protein
MVDFLVFLPACFALNLAFGPNNLLALTHGAEAGPFFAFRASLGRIFVFIPMIALSGLGLGLILAASSIVFTVIKIIGAAYLIWLGLKLLRVPNATFRNGGEAKARTMSEAFKNEALVAVGNPKAILIFAAFFPQFVDQNNYAWSYFALGAAFLMLEMIAILIYAATGRFAASFASSKLHWFQKASGVGMVIFGVLLLFTRRPSVS